MAVPVCLCGYSPSWIPPKTWSLGRTLLWTVFNSSTQPTLCSSFGTQSLKPTQTHTHTSVSNLRGKTAHIVTHVQSFVLFNLKLQKQDKSVRKKKKKLWGILFDYHWYSIIIFANIWNYLFLLRWNCSNIILCGFVIF